MKKSFLIPSLIMALIGVAFGEGIVEQRTCGSYPNYMRINLLNAASSVTNGAAVDLEGLKSQQMTCAVTNRTGNSPISISIQRRMTTDGQWSNIMPFHMVSNTTTDTDDTHSFDIVKKGYRYLRGHVESGASVGNTISLDCWTREW